MKVSDAFRNLLRLAGSATNRPADWAAPALPDFGPEITQRFREAQRKRLTRKKSHQKSPPIRAGNA